MKKRKLKITLALASIVLLITAFFIAEELLEKYKMHQNAITAGINDFLLSANDINEYISNNQELIDIVHYDLDINIYPNEKKIHGKVIIKGVFKDSTLKQIDLNLYDNLEIERLELNSEKVTYSHEGSTLSLFANETEKDTFRVFIEYSGAPYNIGLSSFSFSEKDSNYVISSLNEPIYASTWFPCNDKPDDKALLDIKITNEKQYTSVSNGKLISVTSDKSRKTYQWKTVYPISTYLVTINSGIYTKFSDRYITETDTMDVDFYVFPEDIEKAKKDFFETTRMIEIFSGLFGEYPFIKEKYGIIEFLWQSGAMENQTITAIGSSFVSGYGFFKDILIHELAHHWWGNAVGPKSWKDIWLNEGFATYSEALYFEAESGFASLRSTMINNMDFQDKRLYAPEGRLLSSTVYEKGAWVLHMLRRIVGKEKFFAILRNYFERYKYKNASTEDFKKICEDTAGKDLTQFFNQWVFEGEERIELYTKLSVLNENGKIVNRLRIKQEQGKIFDFPLDIKLYFNNSDSDSVLSFNINTRDTVLLLNVPSELRNYKVDPDNWLLAEITQD